MGTGKRRERMGLGSRMGKGRDETWDEDWEGFGMGRWWSWERVRTILALLDACHQ